MNGEREMQREMEQERKLEVELNGISEEKRSVIRIEKNVSMNVKELQYPLNGVQAKPAITKDLTSAGLCFITTEEYVPGALISIELDLKGWQNYLQSVFSIVNTEAVVKPLTAIAEVVWSTNITGEDGYKVGVRFHDIYEDDMFALQKYLAQIGIRQSLKI